MIRYKLIGYLLLLGFQLKAQTLTPSKGEVSNEITTYHALKNATIWIDYQTKSENATLLIKNNIIEGINVSIPKEAIVIDLNGKHIYPSFIDLYSDYGLDQIKTVNFTRSPQYTSNKTGPYYWNQSIQPENNAAELFKPLHSRAEELRKLGFGTVLSHQQDGIM